MATTAIQKHASTYPTRTTSDLRSEDSSEAAQSFPEETKMPISSGLSALIQAAADQLGHRVDNETASRNARSVPSCCANDGDLRTSAQAETPNIIPEDERKLSFPELLMTVLVDPNNSDISTFLPDGKFFAIRPKEFSEDLLKSRFHLESFEEFLQLLDGWGFSRISGTESGGNGIQVFRHPHFKGGGLRALRSMRFDGRQDKVKIDFSMSDDLLGSIKRPLSPTRASRDSEDTSKKLQRDRGDSVSAMSSDHDRTHLSHGSSMNESDPERSPDRGRSLTDTPSHALAITAARLDLQCSDDEDQHVPTEAKGQHSMRLIDGGVERATRTIVTDAIETLLFDEDHTRETYLKHKQTLSKSSFPGVIPITQQLFAPAGKSSTSRQACEQWATIASKDESSKDSSRTPNPAQLESAAALTKQVSAKDSESRQLASAFVSTESMHL